MADVVKLVIEGGGNNIERDTEDGGRAKILTVDNTPIDGGIGSDIGVFARVQSWDDAKKHDEIMQIWNKKNFRITIEAWD